MNHLLQGTVGRVFDADGFFIDPGLWNEALAHHIAHADGMGQLNGSQLELLQTLRREFKKHGSVTALSHICHLNGQSADCMQKMFPSPREAWRIAGLPNPGEEAKAYM